METVEGLKEELTALKASVHKRVKFLDDKFNAFLNEVHPLFKAQEEKLINLERDNHHAQSNHHHLQDEARNREKQINRMDSQMGGLTTMVWVEEYVKQALIPSHAFMGEMKGYRHRLDQGMLDLNSRLNELHSDVSRIQEELLRHASLEDGLRNSQSILKSNHENLTKTELFGREKTADLLLKQNDRVNEALNGFADSMKRFADKQEQFDDMLKRERMNLSQSMDAKFAALEAGYKDEMLKGQNQRADVLREIDKLAHQVAKPVLNGKSAKEVEDFMKQVMYNAQQIAKINDSLEAK